MNMAICSKENVTAGTESAEITEVCFEAYTSDLAKAGVLLREAVGQVRSLNDSLMGAHPLCGEELGIDVKQHGRMRKFKTPEETLAYQAYMYDLTCRAAALAGAKGDVYPTFADQQAYGFWYEVSSGRAYIAMQFNAADKEWRVCGFAKLKNPDIVRRNLKKKGFEVTTRILGE